MREKVLTRFSPMVTFARSLFLQTQEPPCCFSFNG